MKIRHPLAIKSAAFLLSLAVRAMNCTVRIHEHALDPRVYPARGGEPFIYLFWHENMAIPAALIRKVDISVLISQHRDGELIAQTIGFLGASVVRGSSSRGGGQAIRDMLEAIKQRHLAITPDGPRGPRRVVQPGAVFLASHAGIEIVPVGVAVTREWRAKSWDKMMIPKPFAQAHVVLGKPIAIPPGLDKQALEPYQQLCQRGMDEAQSLAESKIKDEVGS